MPRPLTARVRRAAPVVAVAAALVLAACSSSGGSPRRTVALSPLPTTSTSDSVGPVPDPAPTSSTPARAAGTPRTTSPTSSTRTSPGKSASHPAPSSGSTSARPSVSRLPLGLRTADARQVITVVAPSSSSTTATLQAWRKVSGAWSRVGPAVDAHLGSDGIGRASESTSRTPAGSFTLTQAFGHDANPGTALPYTRTTPADWWISQPGPLYNTRQRCASGCDFTRGDPNEHLYYETPYYDFAVVIDYNTVNAPGGVRQGAGSAFFLHVSVGAPTAGCVSIPKADLARIMRWLEPSQHPRILLGVG